MRKVKVFDGTPMQTQDRINDFLKENNVKLVDMFANGFVDYYSGSQNQICNQWYETTIIYEKNSEDLLCDAMFDHEVAEYDTD